MVDPAGINLLDGRVECHSLVDDKLLEIDRGCNTRKQLELLEDGPTPSDDDSRGDDHGSHRVDPPTNLGTGRGGEDTESIYKEIVPVIFIENLNLARLLPDRETEDEQRELGQEGDPNSDQGGDVDLVGLFIAFPGGETSDGFDDQDQVDHTHQGTVNDISN